MKRKSKSDSVPGIGARPPGLPEQRSEPELAGGIGDIVPGKELEKAAAHVATDAGKSLVRGVARVLGAFTAEWTAMKEARADAARLAIDTRADIARAGELTDARRQQELQELEHQASLQLAKRRADRMIHEMAREQENLEAIMRASVELLEADPIAKPNDLDDAWLLRFAEFAQRVSDKEVQELWSRILASAVLREKGRLSASALLLMSLIDGRTAQAFREFCELLDRVNNFLVGTPFPGESIFTISFAIGSPPPNITVEPDTGKSTVEPAYLEEMDLIQRHETKSLSFETFDLKALNSAFPLQSYALTRRGQEIRQACIPISRGPIGDVRQHFLIRETLLQTIGKASIIPKRNDERLSFQYVVGKKRSGRSSDQIESLHDPQESQVVDQRLLSALKSISTRYEIEVSPID